jgi:hypothetical protein
MHFNLSILESSNLSILVEPLGIEPRSREDEPVPSTCLVDIHFRKKQGHQQPKLLLSYCGLSALSNITRSSSALRHHYTSAGRAWALSGDGSPDLIRTRLI